LRQSWIDGFVALFPDYGPLVESDPIIKLAEAGAFREMVLRQRVNDAAKGVMLAYAINADLENLGAFYGVVRKPAAVAVVTGGGGAGATLTLTIVDGVIVGATPLEPGANYTSNPTVTVSGFGSNAALTASIQNGQVTSYGVTTGGSGYFAETDQSYRQRIQLALESFSVAGPEGAYIFWALSVAEVKDASVTSPDPGEVVVYLLSRSGDGEADVDTINAVLAVLNNEDVRPLTDQVSVESATIISYTIEAELKTFAGPDPNVVIANALASAKAYVVNQHKLGYDITLSGIFAALHVAGVQNVTITEPAADIVVDDNEAAYCDPETGIDLTNGGIGQ